MELIVKIGLAATEIFVISALLQRRYGWPALRKNLMLFNRGLLLAALVLKAWLIPNRPLIWFFIDFMLFFLLSMFYRGELKQQAVFVFVLAAACVVAEIIAAVALAAIAGGSWIAVW